MAWPRRRGLSPSFFSTSFQSLGVGYLWFQNRWETAGASPADLSSPGPCAANGTPRRWGALLLLVTGGRSASRGTARGMEQLTRTVLRFRLPILIGWILVFVVSVVLSHGLSSLLTNRFTLP